MPWEAQVLMLSSWVTCHVGVQDFFTPRPHGSSLLLRWRSPFPASSRTAWASDGFISWPQDVMVHIFHGAQDPVVPLSTAMLGQRRLQALGFRLGTVQGAPGGRSWAQDQLPGLRHDERRVRRGGRGPGTDLLRSADVKWWEEKEAKGPIGCLNGDQGSNRRLRHIG